MNDTNQPQSNKNKHHYLNWLLWWRVDENELNRQVAEYHQLSVFRSARGQSLLLLLLSAIITTIAVFALNLDKAPFIDVTLFIITGFFIYRGHRWAMVFAMLLWTFEKAVQIFTPLPVHSTNPLIPIIWWTIYMHAFYSAFRVECKRIKLANKP